MSKDSQLRSTLTSQEWVEVLSAEIRTNNRNREVNVKNDQGMHGALQRLHDSYNAPILGRFFSDEWDTSPSKINLTLKLKGLPYRLHPYEKGGKNEWDKKWQLVVISLPASVIEKLTNAELLDRIVCEARVSKKNSSTFDQLKTELLTRLNV